MDEPYPLPAEWRWEPLEALAEVRTGVAKGRALGNSDTVQVPYLRVANVQNGYLNLGEVKTIEIRRSEIDRYSLKPNDILFTEGGDRDKLGRGAVWKGEIERCVHQNHVFAARPRTPDVLPAWISLASQAQYARDYFMAVARQTVNLASINATKLRSFPVPVPPIDEQRRLLAKHERLTSESRTARKALDRVPALLKRFRQAVLAAAFRGGLTERDPSDEPADVLLERIWKEKQLGHEVVPKARGERSKKSADSRSEQDFGSMLPDLPHQWCWARLDDLLVRIDAGHSPTAQNRPADPDEYGVLKVSAVSWGEFQPAENKALLPGTFVNRHHSIRAGDLLISRANTVNLVGAVVLVERDHPNLLLSDKTLRLVPIIDDIPRRFLLYALRTEWARSAYEEKATGTSNSMRNISQDTIRSAPIPVPPLAEQQRIVARLDRLFAEATAIEEATEAARCHAEQVDQAILARAFRGEL